MPMLPIVFTCGRAVYNTTKFITEILQNYCGKTSSFLKDSTDFVKKVNRINTSLSKSSEIQKNKPESHLMSVFSSPAYQYLLHYKLSIPKFLPAPVSPVSARSLQNNSSSFWNSL